MHIKTYVICLAKTRTKRCDPTVRAWSTLDGLDVVRLPATTPKDFQLAKVVHPYAYACIKHKERKTLEMIGADVEVACALSHIKAWQRIVQDNAPGIVVEDDMAMPTHKLARMVSHLTHLPQNTDMYLLQFNGVNLKARSMPNGFIDVHSFSGLMAYYLTPSCAKTLLTHALPIVFQVDAYVSKSRVMYKLNIRSKPENRMSFLKFAKDNLRSTLGNKHVSSGMLTMAIALVVMTIVVVVLSVLWTTHGMTKRHELQRCALRLKHK